MNCFPESVTGYVDGELDRAVGAEVEAHLAHCPECSRQAREERNLREQLGALAAPDLPRGLEFTLRRRLKSRRRTTARWLVPFAASLAVVAVALWGRAEAPFIAWELARDHRHCFAHGRVPAEIWSTDPAVVQQWFRERGTTVPRLPGTAGRVKLVGARFCPLVDRQIAHLYYMDEGRQLSLFVIPGPVNLDTATAFQTQARGRAVRLERLGEHTVGIVARHQQDVSAFARALGSRTARHPGGGEWASADTGPSARPQRMAHHLGRTSVCSVVSPRVC